MLGNLQHALALTASGADHSLRRPMFHEGKRDMRDIRGDLEERAKICREQIKSSHAQFEMMAQKLQRERDARIADLKSMLVMVQRIIEFENSHMDKVVTLPNTSVQHMTLAERMAAVSD